MSNETSARVEGESGMEPNWKQCHWCGKWVVDPAKHLNDCEVYQNGI